MFFHWNLRDSKSPQVSRTLLSLLADLNNAVVWMVPSRPLISKSSSSLTNPLLIVPSAPITIGITVTIMLHSFFSSLARSRYLSLYFTFLQFYPVVSRNGKIHYSVVSLYFVDYRKIWSSGRDYVIRFIP